MIAEHYRAAQYDSILLKILILQLSFKNTIIYLFPAVNMVKCCDNIVFSMWSIYINKVLLDKRSKSILDVLPDDTIKRILNLVFKNQKWTYR